MLFHSQQAKSTLAKHGKNSRVFVSTWQIEMKTGNFFEKPLEGHPKKKTVVCINKGISVRKVVSVVVSLISHMHIDEESFRCSGSRI